MPQPPRFPAPICTTQHIPADQRGARDALAFADGTIARKLISRRTKSGLTQKALAKKAGVRLETICRLEGGKHAPTRETINRLDAALTKAGA